MALLGFGLLLWLVLVRGESDVSSSSVLDTVDPGDATLEDQQLLLQHNPTLEALGHASNADSKPIHLNSASELSYCERPSTLSTVQQDDAEWMIEAAGTKVSINRYLTHFGLYIKKEYLPRLFNNTYKVERFTAKPSVEDDIDGNCFCQANDNKTTDSSVRSERTAIPLEKQVLLGIAAMNIPSPVWYIERLYPKVRTRRDFPPIPVPTNDGKPSSDTDAQLLIINDAEDAVLDDQQRLQQPCCESDAAFEPTQSNSVLPASSSYTVACSGDDEYTKVPVVVVEGEDDDDDYFSSSPRGDDDECFSSPAAPQDSDEWIIEATGTKDSINHYLKCFNLYLEQEFLPDTFNSAYTVKRLTTKSFAGNDIDGDDFCQATDNGITDSSAAVPLEQQVLRGIPTRKIPSPVWSIKYQCPLWNSFRYFSILHAAITNDGKPPPWLASTDAEILNSAASLLALPGPIVQQ